METFSPFSISVDVMLGKEALAVLMTLSQLMAGKLEEPILQACVWVNNWITIVVLMSYYCINSVYSLTSTLQEKDMDWDSIFGLGFMQ